ncbi:MAG: putative Carboxylesterase (Est-2) [Promethearchaeota archaeon]|nr:MAG: putative Carboxylesterase (Est-2) [Candidatus Lokiarchaeota archaeon]
MSFIQFENGKIHYLIKSSSETNEKGSALIFIHGSGEHSFVWKEQMENIEPVIPLIAIDLPSHGKSSEFANLSLDLYIEAVKSLKEELQLKTILLCGHSLGGAVAQGYYFKYPNDIIGLILMSTGAKLRVLPRILEETKNDFNKFLDSIEIGSFYRKTLVTIITEYVQEISKIKPSIVHRDFQICNEFNVMNKLGSIGVPCLIIVGKADKLTPVKYHKYFHSHIEDSELHIIDEAGHAVMVEKPPKVNQLIEKFLHRFK